MTPFHIVFVSVLDETMASHRFRVTKIAPLMKAKGVGVDTIRVRPYLGAVSAFRILFAMLNRAGKPCIVVFQKTIDFPLARLVKSLGAKLLMDWDDGGFQRIDGTYYPEDFQREFIRWVGMMDGTVASCQQIRDWLHPWNNRGYIIPTCIDVENYRLLERSGNSKCVIGWVGSTMSKYFLGPIEPALSAVSRLPGVEIFAVGANDPCLTADAGIRFVPWRLEMEPSIFSQIDIGIMPLPDNERARMKAGFKLLQYMAAGIPVVASPVGVNCEIVRSGWNGFLATTPAEWEKYLTMLLSDPELRIRLGKNGKTFVSEKYHLGVAADLWEKASLDVIGCSRW